MKSCLTAPRGLMLLDDEHVVRGVGVQHRSRPIMCWRKHTTEDRPSLIEGVDIAACWCGLAVYVVSMHGGFQLRADLTPDEAREIRARGWRLDDVLRYVGAELHDRVA